ncbi:MAG TPA: hypothetical protein VLH10_14300 [Yinghuangia sp.]|nr:hypothetical protein [Yinghuangia sp.]
MRHHELNVLLTEAHPGDSETAAALLAGAGHRVHRCHPVARPATGAEDTAEQTSGACVAWHTGGKCPLTTTAIDVVVDARRVSGPETPREQGAMCATLTSVPLVVCGPADTRNTVLLKADSLCDAAHLLAACRSAASPAGRAAHRAVTQAVRTALTGLGDPPAITVELVLRQDTVIADITIAATPSATTYTRVRGAVRTALARFTPSWPYIPVTVHHSAPAQRAPLSAVPR